MTSGTKIVFMVWKTCDIHISRKNFKFERKSGRLKELENREYVGVDPICPFGGHVTDSLLTLIRFAEDGGLDF